ncbi:uncharacterized protein SPPG_02732 [Spizellomyces punctatus DAOM BR117]|uniref:SH3 domain-containing protein n=1 Tax=Spizellomyces punctatus (strain DAOM BR117) TaxID=645134 RepID=A0A0L0HMC1_SPIPD|nr:uncharacterized protein SPPG_02732 [Spizellomyces punctatus DAOM BR117]KND02252.1 hypothetical protein SPPG_02732 [Spizellomyces punctatus DAOM BR117]|eukprot:XP_016610291.1 hypothetical protein SPPG_02732 [Spizellomyces punctatus DAOM BR117]
MVHGRRTRGWTAAALAVAVSFLATSPPNVDALEVGLPRGSFMMAHGPGSIKIWGGSKTSSFNQTLLPYNRQLAETDVTVYYTDSKFNVSTRPITPYMAASMSMTCTDYQDKRACIAGMSMLQDATDGTVLTMLNPNNFADQNVTAIGAMTPRWSMCGGLLGDKWYLFGGRGAATNTTYFDDFFVINLATKTLESTVTAPAVKRGSACMAPADSTSLVLYGGGGADGVYDDTWIYNANTNQWRNITTDAKAKGRYPEARFAAECVFINGNLYMFGGAKIFNQATNEIWRFDVPSLSWQLVFPPLNGGSSTSIVNQASPRYYPAVLGIGDLLVVFGGRDLEGDARASDDPNMYFFDVKQSKWVDDATAFAALKGSANQNNGGGGGGGGDGGSSKTPIIAGVAGGAVALLLAIGGFVMYKRRRPAASKPVNLEYAVVQANKPNDVVQGSGQPPRPPSPSVPPASQLGASARPLSQETIVVPPLVPGQTSPAAAQDYYMTSTPAQLYGSAAALRPENYQTPSPLPANEPYQPGPAQYDRPHSTAQLASHQSYQPTPGSYEQARLPHSEHYERPVSPYGDLSQRRASLDRVMTQSSPPPYSFPMTDALHTAVVRDVTLPVGPAKGDKIVPVDESEGLLHIGKIGFQPRAGGNSDEIAISPGDILYVKELFRDGWALGWNSTKGTSGFFPYNCVEKSG